MTDANTQPPTTTNAQRQAEFKQRRHADGYKRATVWIRQTDYERGMSAAEFGSTNASDCPNDADRLSWMLGYCTVLDRRAEARTRAELNRKKGE